MPMWHFVADVDEKSYKSAKPGCTFFCEDKLRAGKQKGGALKKPRLFACIYNVGDLSAYPILSLLESHSADIFHSEFLT